MDKAKETFEDAKEKVYDAAKNMGADKMKKKIGEKYDAVKEKLQDSAESASESLKDIKQSAEHIKTQVLHGGTTPSAKGKSSTYDPRGSQEHVDQIIEKNQEEFKKFDKKHGGSGKDNIKGGFDPVSCCIVRILIYIIFQKTT